MNNNNKKKHKFLFISTIYTTGKNNISFELLPWIESMKGLINENLSIVVKKGLLILSNKCSNILILYNTYNYVPIQNESNINCF